MAISKKISDRVKEAHLKILKQVGAEGLYNQAVSACLFNSTQLTSPEIELLDLSEAFLALYRRTGGDDFLIICKALRRAAHKVHRVLSKKTDNFIKSPRFITVC
ncbi:MAG: hypothetical protein Q8P20_00620 [bacterium]|nr:hypothetical protein [bacterium]